MFMAIYDNTDVNLDGEDATEEDLGVGADPARSLQHVVQQLPRHLSSRSCDRVQVAFCGWIFCVGIFWVNICVNILWVNILPAHQSSSQADMLLDAERLNLGLDKEAEVLQVSHLQF